MEVITIPWAYIEVAILFVIVAITLWLVMHYRKVFAHERDLLAEEKQRTKNECEKMVADATQKGEKITNDLLLQAKEEVRKLRIELENNVRSKRNELNTERKRISVKENNIDQRSERLSKREQELNEAERALDNRELQIVQGETKLVEELERVSGLSMGEARELVLSEAKTEYQHDMAVMLKQLEEETKAKADRYAKEIIVSSIQRYASDYVSDATVSVVNLPNDEMKGRIIGREGRNIRTLENLTGIDLIIDDTPEAVILSGYDPIRREIARKAIEMLVFDGRIHPARIEEMVNKAKREMEQTIKEAGEQAVFETGVVGIHPEVVRIIGRMKFRTSYGQNCLQHSMEVATLAGIMASQLGLDTMVAKRAGLLHDIGKAVDFEMEGTHVALGAAIARKYNESDEVVNAIESHHGDVEAKYLISGLVAAADAISAARPGARSEQLETYIKRIEKLEEIANSFEGVEKSFAVQAGRELRVIVQPEKMKDDEMVLRAHEISKKIEQELRYPGEIKIQLIRESRIVDYAR